MGAVASGGCGCKLHAREGEEGGNSESIQGMERNRRGEEDARIGKEGGRGGGGRRAEGRAGVDEGDGAGDRRGW